MNSLVLFKTKSTNRYFYDFKENKVLFCHPLFHHLLNLYKKGKDIKRWLNSIKKGRVEIEDCGVFSKKEIEYYYKKILLLKENGYFSAIDRTRYLSRNTDADRVKSELANLRQVVFEVTDSCNLKCEYCGYGKFYSDYDKRSNKNLRLEIAKNTLQYLLKLWNSSLNISHGTPIYIGFYGGEPLINMPFVREIVRYVKDLKVLHNWFRFSMTTNGILVAKYMDFLAENDFSLLVSLDGDAKSNAYRVFTNGKPSYEYSFKSVMALKKKHPAYFKKSVNFNSVLHNKNSVSGIHRYFKKMFKEMPRIAELNTSGIRPSRKKEFWETYRNFYENLHQAEDYSLIERDMFIGAPDIRSTMEFIDQHSGNVFQNYNDLFYSKEGFTRHPTGTCPPFARKLFLTVNGKVLPCERIGQHYGLGHADDNAIELNFEKIAKKYNHYYDKMRKRCNVCFNFSACMQCLFHLDTLEKKSPECNGFMNYTDFGRYLSSRMYFLEKRPGLYSRLIKEVRVD